MSSRVAAARKSSSRRRILLARSLPCFRRRSRSLLQSSSSVWEEKVMFKLDSLHLGINPRG
jgi:hypothetical protein